MRGGVGIAGRGAAGAVGAEVAGGGGGAVIVFDNVSKFYGEVLGVNKVDLHIPPGIDRKSVV